MLHLKLFTAVVLAAVLIAGAATAQPAAGALDAEARKAVVQKAAVALRDRYVLIEPGERAAARIEAQLAAGAYDALTDPRAFATKITADLYEVTKDKHLSIRANGQPSPNAAPAGPPPPRSEGGVVRADRLAGGVAYIEINSFAPPGAFIPAVNRAMAAVADAPALIIDLRRNGGGSAISVDYLASFFVDPTQKVKILDYRQRTPGSKELKVQESWSVKTPTSFVGKPVYVLTSARTFSGGEGLAYELQSMKVALTVGEVTGGGANPGGSGPLTPQFGMFVPTGSPVHPATGTNWEGVGVIPNIPSSTADALKVALERAGQKPQTGDIESLSLARLFGPRSEPLPGTEAAVRALAEGLGKGEPPYDRMTDSFADTTRRQLPALQQAVGKLGSVRSITFVGPGGNGDQFVVAMTEGSLNFSVGLDAQGKISAAQFGPVPVGQ